MSLWDWFVQLDETDTRILLHLKNGNWHTITEMTANSKLMSNIGTRQTLRNRLKVMRDNGYILLEINDQGLQQAKLTTRKTLSNPLRSGKECVEDIQYLQKKIKEREDGNGN